MSKTATTAKKDTKAALIEAGVEIITKRGFNQTGIEAVLKTVGVPKGSFYYYFKNKDDFGLSVLEYHNTCYQKKLDAYFNNKVLSPLNRLKLYLGDGCKSLEEKEFKSGCLVGNLSQELADQHEAFRTRLEEIFTDRIQQFANCFREAQALQELSPELDPMELAEFTMFSFEGAILRSKVTRSAAPLNTFIKLLFEKILKGCNA